MVIQRWQSVLLLIAAVLMACFTFLSLGQAQLPDYTYDFSTLGFSREGIPTDGSLSGYECRTWYFFTVSLMSAVIPLIAIFCFKNMRLQKRLCLVTIMFIVAVIAVGAVLGYTHFEGYSVSWSSNIIEPFISLVAVIMAWQFISRDQARLYAADRLR